MRISMRRHILSRSTWRPRLVAEFNCHCAFPAMLRLSAVSVSLLFLGDSVHYEISSCCYSPRCLEAGGCAKFVSDFLHTACCYEIEPGSAMDACRRTWAPKTADNFHCHACRSIGPSSE